MKPNSEIKSVLFVTKTLQGGGAERVMLTFIDSLLRRGIKVTVFAQLKTGELSEQLPASVDLLTAYNHFVSNHFHSTPETVKKNSLLRFLHRIFIKTMYVVYIRQYCRNEEKRINSLMEGKKFDAGINLSTGPLIRFLPKYQNIFHILINWVHVDYSKVLIEIPKDELLTLSLSYHSHWFVSSGAKNGFFESLPELKNRIKCSVIYNPIDIGAVRKSAEEKCDYIKKLPVVLAVGRLSEEKKHDRLIEVHYLLIEEGIKHELIIAGSGGKEKFLREKINGMNLQNSCKMIGFQKNPHKWMKLADVVVLTSDYEAYPLVLGEAMVLHKAILASNIAGCSEILENGKWGRLTETSVDSIKSNLKDMLTHPEKRNEYSEKLRQATVFAFDKEKINLEIINEMNDLLRLYSISGTK